MARQKQVEAQPTELETMINSGMASKGFASIRDVEKAAKIPVDALRDIMRGKTKRNRLRKVDYLTRVASLLGVPPAEMANAAGIITIYDDKSHRKVNLDMGTPEVQLRRSMLARGGNPRLCGYPLGVLLARFEIGQPGVSPRHHDAGVKFGELYRSIAADCRPTLNAATLARVVHSTSSGKAPPDNLVAMRQAMYRAADDALGAMREPLVYAETFNVCLLDTLPDWADVMPDENPVFYRELRKGNTPLQRGLEKLSQHFNSPAHFRIAERFDVAV